jgi:hypothetical protein
MKRISKRRSSTSSETGKDCKDNHFVSKVTYQI